MPNSKWKSFSQLFLVKIAAVLLALFFLSFAALFLSYCFISVASTIKGRDAKIMGVASQYQNHSTACHFGGFFQVVVEVEQKKVEKIYCLYPAWPEKFQPVKGDEIRVWPPEKPLVGAVSIDGWGWFIVGTLLVVGFIMVEFAFLALTIR